MLDPGLSTWAEFPVAVSDEPVYRERCIEEEQLATGKSFGKRG